MQEKQQVALYEECVKHLRDQRVRAAFAYMVAYGRSLSDYKCYLQRQGYFVSYRYRRGRTWPFGFIVNQQSLLFYFRPAGLSHAAANIAALAQEFDDVSCNNRKEIKVRLVNEGN